MEHKLLPFVIVWGLISVAKPSDLVNLTLDGKLSLDPLDIAAASGDFGGTARSYPLAVLRPTSANDVIDVVRAAYESPIPFPVSARGHGHSIHGQAGATDGVVVEMGRVLGRAATPGKKFPQRSLPVGTGGGEYYVDVWGGELWIDVLRWTLENGGLAPRSWTDYLYLSVGGTLSNAGISGQAFRHGPQISNVLELDVVTGKGELLTCNKEHNQDLFHAVLGGLGQFGIITRARIALEPAPKRTRWIRMLYSNFTVFTKDQEYLIALQGTSPRFDYVEGLVIVDESPVNSWRSSFFSPANTVKMGAIAPNGEPLYCLEVTKNYDDRNADSVDVEVELLMRKLGFVRGAVFTTDVKYVDFLDRVHGEETKLRSEGLWEVPHPWLNLFVPGSRMPDFDRRVFKGILGKKTSGPILVYPMSKRKWDEKSSVVLPEEEEVFYLVAFLKSAIGGGEEAQSLEQLLRQNDRIIQFCREGSIGCKQYLPHHVGRQQWRQHFGLKWVTFLRRKMEFDPRGILGTGQGIFHVDSSPVQSS